MLIDWFTVAAQALNFIILVWLMKRYLFHPVLDAIAARENKIAKQLADADAVMAEAHKKQAEFEDKSRAFDQQKTALLQKATQEAASEGERLRAEAIEAVDQANAARAKAILADTQMLHDELVHRTQQQVFDITRRALQDLSDTSLEQRSCEVFIQRLHAIDAQTLELLGEGLRSSSDSKPALVTSAFELPDAQKSELNSAIETVFGQVIKLKFQVEPELVAGIELSANGQKLAWSIADYLNNLKFSPAIDTHKPQEQQAR